MIKKTAAMAIAFFALAGAGHALNMEIGMEMKTGVIWDDGRPVQVGIHHNYYAGPALGRMRMDMHLWSGNLGIRLRFQQQTWAEGDNVMFNFAYAYGNFLDEQLRISIGSLSNSPWRAGGPTIWQGLDHGVGIRAEIMPRIVPGLNFGFTINHWDYMLYFPDRETLGALMMETLIGVAYTNDHFHARFGWRLDSDADVDNEPQDGHSLMYRLEPRFLTNLVPGLRVWANGWWRAVGPRYVGRDEVRVRDFSLMNWLYVEYAQRALLARLRLGAEFSELESNFFFARPSFHYWILPSVRAGMYVYYQHNFGSGATVTDVPFHTLAFQPEVRFQFGPAYLSLVYHFRMVHNAAGERLDRQWINLRAVIAF